ncbi:MAG TPA: hypothetical protein VG939_11360 [Caulobacteraceae bacterium]|nr:hypothetical protein [Caulobacteraceae bacterium]
MHTDIPKILGFAVLALLAAWSLYRALVAGRVSVAWTGISASRREDAPVYWVFVIFLIGIVAALVLAILAGLRIHL